MNRISKLILIAVIVFAVIFFVQRPDVLDEIWLWLIGLSGAIIQLFRRLLGFFKDDDSNTENQAPSPTWINSISSRTKQVELQELAADDFKGVTLTVLRYSDDGSTTIGLLYLNGFFYCYTLEDTKRDEKIAGITRIPAGRYELDFIRYETELTKKYRKIFPDWFNYHLEIKNVPGFQGIYMHSGGDHEDTNGCLLVSDNLNISGDNKFLTNSKNTFKRLYTYLSGEIESGTKVRIIIRDEAWIAKLNA